MSGAAKLRIGLIGSGTMGRHHVKAIAASGRGEIVGVADPAASADELAPVLPGGAVVVASASELYAHARPDVVHIVTPPSTHAALAFEAIGAGCHVYVEKPFTPTAVEAESVVRRAEERGVKVCAGHQVLFEAPALAAREHLARIGRLVHVESYFSFRMVRRTITPVDQVKDILPHAVYPVVEHLRAGTGITDAPIEILGASVDAMGETYALLRLGNVTAVLLVTLNGRPIEHYVQIVGTNGSLRADFIGGYLGQLIGPAESVGVLLTPYRRALHTLTGATRGIARLVMGGSYPGLRTLIDSFYESIQNGTPPPLSTRSIVDTVALCEQLGARLDAVEATFEADAQAKLVERERTLPATRPDAPRVLLTGGTGLLGKRIAEQLRAAGYPVRVVSRRLPPYSRRVPGVEYAAGDLARGLDPALLTQVGYVVHAAAETSGGKEDHRRNSVEATRKLIEGAAKAGIRGFLHVSSLAVLKTSREVGDLIDESTPVDQGNLQRGPYVWGKAESEIVARRVAAEMNVPLRVIRPGPLVDYAAYQPPGRLGREVGPWFVAIGPRNGALSVCDVTTAANVVCFYLDDFERAPAVLNMVEAPAPTRRELMDRYLHGRPDLRVLWFPAWLLRLASGPLKLAQRVVMGSKEPVDVAAAFASERYRTDLAARVIAEANRPERAASAR